VPLWPIATHCSCEDYGANSGDVEAEDPAHGQCADSQIPRPEEAISSAQRRNGRRRFRLSEASRSIANNAFHSLEVYAASDAASRFYKP